MEKQKNKLEALPCSYCHKHCSFEHSLSENVLLLFQNEEHMHEMRSFNWGSVTVRGFVLL